MDEARASELLEEYRRLVQSVAVGEMPPEALDQWVETVGGATLIAYVQLAEAWQECLRSIAQALSIKVLP